MLKLRTETAAVHWALSVPLKLAARYRWMARYWRPLVMYLSERLIKEALRVKIVQECIILKRCISLTPSSFCLSLAASFDSMEDSKRDSTRATRESAASDLSNERKGELSSIDRTIVFVGRLTRDVDYRLIQSRQGLRRYRNCFFVTSTTTLINYCSWLSVSHPCDESKRFLLVVFFKLGKMNCATR